MHPVGKVLVSLVVSVIVFFITPPETPGLITAMILWNTFALCYLVFSWIVIFKRNVSQIKQMAKKDDGSVAYVFLLIIVSSFASLITVAMLVISNDKNLSGNPFYVPVAIAGILLSWFMVHTTYTVHYAHMYYDDDEDAPGKDAHGLEFPGNDDDAKDKLDYIDFAYFSFVLGCTFQVSDVEISSKKIRRVALVHGLLSFGLNTFVVALTINLIAGLSK